MRGTRITPPDEFESLTVKADIGAISVYFIIGMYEDGSPCSVQITLNKEGDKLRVYHLLGDCITLGLQYGVPIDEYIDIFQFQSMEPSGVTSHADVPFVKSIMDFFARWLAIRFQTTDNEEE